jgi:hypothetical protein
LGWAARPELVGEQQHSPEESPGYLISFLLRENGQRLSLAAAKKKSRRITRSY